MSHTFPTETHLCTWNPEGDAFGRQDLAIRVVQNILTKMDTPNVLGIYGDWGTGKTTFLHYVQMVITGKQKNEKEQEVGTGDKKLDDFRASLKKEDSERGDLDKIAIVHFEPWKYEYAKDTDLLFALFEKIRKDLNIGDDFWAPVASAALKLSTDFVKHSLNSIIKNRVGLDIQEVAGKMGEALDVERVEKYGKMLPLYENWFSEFDELQILFKKFIIAGLEKKEKEKLIIFIDDLDRCLPENTIKLLEAIKNFLFQDKVIFVLALDHGVVSEMIEKKYGLHSGYGEEYLDKIINYSFILNKVSFLPFVRDILKNHTISISDTFEKEIIGFLNRFLHEPRRTKRILRQFAMSGYLGVAKKRKNPEHIFYLDDDRYFRHLFLAVYLEIKFPRYFTGSTTNISKHLRLFEGGEAVDSLFNSKDLMELMDIKRFYNNLQDNMKNLREAFEELGRIS